MLRYEEFKQVFWQSRGAGKMKIGVQATSKEGLTKTSDFQLRLLEGHHLWSRSKQETDHPKTKHSDPHILHWPERRKTPPGSEALMFSYQARGETTYISTKIFNVVISQLYNTQLRSMFNLLTHLKADLLISHRNWKVLLCDELPVRHKQ